MTTILLLIIGILLVWFGLTTKGPVMGNLALPMIAIGAIVSIVAFFV